MWMTYGSFINENVNQVLLDVGGGAVMLMMVVIVLGLVVMCRVVVVVVKKVLSENALDGVGKVKKNHVVVCSENQWCVVCGGV